MKFLFIKLLKYLFHKEKGHSFGMWGWKKDTTYRICLECNYPQLKGQKILHRCHTLYKVGGKLVSIEKFNNDLYKTLYSLNDIRK